MSTTTEVATTMGHVVPGDVFVGSGFTATSYAARLTRTPAGKVTVSGFYPGQPRRAHTFNRSSRVTVTRKG